MAQGFTQRMEDERASKGLCPFCGKRSTRVVEVTISEKPLDRGPRGKRIASVSRRLCERHAEDFYNLLREPRARGRRREDG